MALLEKILLFVSNGESFMSGDSSSSSDSKIMNLGKDTLSPHPILFVCAVAWKFWEINHETLFGVH